MEFHKGRLFDHVHLRVQDLDASKRFYRAVLDVLGVPFFSESPHHPGYYGAFVLDPDGNNIEAVFHGPVTRSAESVVMKPTF
ncbi:conserved hypothetical protein [Myxococcus xanthus DK 1622]|uniref:VOC domain-containing protein n=1 Tax=Myxococcus xanthus (strain DK1622) TaxID=246197 RepID=Q1D7L3_MYXXD|nr:MULTISPECIES: hypothetical protein [Myxococcus]ABF87650.1 conserved hypothetical protein [Myxococcus xanthus DK 1622]NOJ52908.1 hypothetical protein [Myxococcus xanthus]QPM82611.1 hypothetical protein I5Q59_15625 [Myxococcus xanthus]QVW64916.1 hypothetical protein JTM82_20970 [Myxococcus xanthus DZ2]QZZ50867.1 hypothetical protein MyxoNM_16810 [Myxococcus xanthus]